MAIRAAGDIPRSAQHWYAQPRRGQRTSYTSILGPNLELIDYAGLWNNVGINKWNGKRPQPEIQAGLTYT